jgi:putative ABC transport system permease protein
MFKDYLKIAFTNLRHRRLRTWLTMIGIFIGIAAVVALISLGQGLQAAVTAQFVDLGSDKLIIQGKSQGFGPPGSGVIRPLTTGDLDVVEQVNGIDGVIGRLLRPVKLEFKDEVNYGALVSVPKGESAKKLTAETIGYEIEQGRDLKDSDQYKVVIGASYVDDVFKKTVAVGDKINIQGQDFEVVGILKKTGGFTVDLGILMNEDVMRDLLDVPDEVDLIGAKVLQGQDIERVAQDIERKLRRYRDVEEGKEDFSVQTPQQFVDTLNSILLIVQTVIIGIASISLLVGAVGITNTMYTAVLERRKEIGIMKAVGAKNTDIGTIFLIESGLLGLAGGAIGVGFGVGLAKTAEFIGTKVWGTALLQAQINPVVIIGALVFAFLLGSLSGVSPALQAAKLNPVEALSYAK